MYSHTNISHWHITKDLIFPGKIELNDNRLCVMNSYFDIGTIFSYNLRYIGGFGLVEMARALFISALATCSRAWDKQLAENLKLYNVKTQITAMNWQVVSMYPSPLETSVTRGSLNRM